MQSLSSECRPEKLQQAVDAAIVESQSTDHAEQLGVVNPFDRTDQPTIDNAVQLKYRQLYADFERSLKKRAVQADKEAKKLQQVDEDVKHADPTDIFNKAVELEVNTKLTEKLVELGFMAPEDEAMPSASTATSTLASDLVSAIQRPKNVRSPQVRVGHNSNLTPQAKPKAKAQAKQHLPQGQGSGHSGRRQGRRGPRTGTPTW